MSEYCTCATSFDGSCEIHDQITALKAQLAEVTAQRDIAEANLARLQDRWGARPATGELEARLAEAEREQDDMHRVRLLLYAERDALKAQLAEVTAQRDIAEANLARLQDRWDARPATGELEARLAECRERVAVEVENHAMTAALVGKELALLEENATLRARLAEAEERLQEACERMSEAETTARVLIGQLPEYSEGQQMLRSLATKMGDSVKRIRAFLNKVWDEKNEEGLL